MPNNNEDRAIEQFELFLDKNMLFEGDTGLSDSTKIRVDILDRMLEFWRFYRGQSENEITLDYFFSLERNLLPNGIMSVRRGLNKNAGIGAPISPSELQLSLLLFLLVQDREELSVLSIIERFIAEMRPYLSPFDLEKTKTGATRCFTNTRFAAATLRYYGLLKYTREEAFKTWKLSFLGLIIAGLAYDVSWRDILARSSDGNWLYPSDFSQSLKRALNAVNKQDVFAKIAESLCSSQAAPFSLARQSLGRIHRLVSGYVEKTRAEGMKTADKKSIIAKAGELIEADPMTRDYGSNIKRSFELSDFSSRLWDLVRYERGL